MSEWQPIETAPRDGKGILTFAGDGEPTIAVGCYIFADSMGTWRDDGCEPTHWMPLPEPPEAA